MTRGSGIETELKYLHPDLERVRERLNALGAKLASPRSLETNITFDDERWSLRDSDRLLRLRDGRELTLKLPLEDARFKSRQEINVGVDGGDVEELLAGLGYRPRWRYEKWREGWDLDGMWITLDEVPYIGPVIEIEGPGERIPATADALGIGGLETSTANYRALFEEYARVNGVEPGDLTFAAAEAAGR
jgi:adenylate cyclase class 2